MLSPSPSLSLFRAHLHANTHWRASGAWRDSEAANEERRGKEKWEGKALAAGLSSKLPSSFLPSWIQCANKCFFSSFPSLHCTPHKHIQSKALLWPLWSPKLASLLLSIANAFPHTHCSARHNWLLKRVRGSLSNSSFQLSRVATCNSVQTPTH